MQNRFTAKQGQYLAFIHHNTKINPASAGRSRHAVLPPGHTAVGASDGADAGGQGLHRADSGPATVDPPVDQAGGPTGSGLAQARRQALTVVPLRPALFIA